MTILTENTGNIVVLKIIFCKLCEAVVVVDTKELLKEIPIPFFYRLSKNSCKLTKLGDYNCLSTYDR